MSSSFLSSCLSKINFSFYSLSLALLSSKDSSSFILVSLRI
jgi:hypothetical protein